MKKNQAGFGVVEGLLVLVITGIIGFTGWYVWQSKSKTNDALNNAANSQTDPNKNDSPVAAPAQQDVKYLEIPEYGVKFKLSTDIADAYYQVNSESSAGTSLRVHSLDVEPDCKSGKNSVAALLKVGKDEVNPLAEKKYSESMKGAVIGDYFYYIGNAQYSCVQDPKNQFLLEKVRTAFSEASSTIEKL